MLREFVHVKQEKGPGRRRWFESTDFELIVWLDAGGTVDGYQICYDLGRGEHALTWRARQGFTHDSVDDGESRKNGKMSPILVPDGAVPWGELVERFSAEGTSLEPELQELVTGTLKARK